MIKASSRDAHVACNYLIVFKIEDFSMLQEVSYTVHEVLFWNGAWYEYDPIRYDRVYLHYTSAGSTVSIYALDLSKAFDKMNHNLSN